MAKAHTFDAIVLDVMLPGLDGFQTSARLRADGVWAPVLMLTARDAIDDRIVGLDSGADDYLTKPFSIASYWHAFARSSAAEPPSDRRSSSLETCASTRRRSASGAATSRSDCRTRSSRCWSSSCAGPGEVVSRFQLLEYRGTWPTTTVRTSSPCTSVDCRRQAAGPRRRPPGYAGVGTGEAVGDERVPSPVERDTCELAYEPRRRKLGATRRLDSHEHVPHKAHRHGPRRVLRTAPDGAAAGACITAEDRPGRAAGERRAQAEHDGRSAAPPASHYSSRLEHLSRPTAAGRAAPPLAARP
jgi:CheY-like chemotaxis protein